MKLIVGLGNPGPEYAYTRHNIGFIAVDHLIEVWGGKWRKQTYDSVLSQQVRQGTDSVEFMKPLTYMNLSGKAVKAESLSRGLALDDILVIYDDIALEFGRLRLRPAGSAGGHKGMMSIISSLGSVDVPRLRIGVGVPYGEDIKEWVLSRFSKEEEKKLPDILDSVDEAVRLYMSLGAQKAMSFVNAHK